MTAAVGPDLIYLDHNATTPLAPEALDAMLPYLQQHFGNPSSDHPLGKRAHQAVEESRELVASLIGAAPGEIVFTYGGTESNNLAIRGCAASAPPGRRRIVTSRVEHPATSGPCDLLESKGWTITRVPVTPAGTLDPETVENALATDVALVTVMLAQNETGAIMAIPAVAEAARRSGIVIHTDAAQAIGKIPVSVEALGVDLLSVAGHKCYGPKGAGALYVRGGTTLEPVIRGAGQERGLRPGTENVAGIVGLAAACGLAQSRLTDEGARMRTLRDTLWEALSERIVGLVRHTPMDTALPNTLTVSFPGVPGWEVLAHAEGLAASTGSACHVGQQTPSVTLLAMGVPPDVALGAVRLSLGHDNNPTEIATAADILVTAHQDAIRP
ncbi:MAG: cysteine desulfurase family protein [Actinomycetota bacterium]|jgi:cysteine desulfurase|nr:cysteine desulfurase family protein [Actinomycetota bacterium]